MLFSALPARFAAIWANAAGGGFIRTIPVGSQIGIQNGAASLADGFPPLTFLPTGSGGVPPFGQDTNGILNQITAWNQWQAAGGPVTFNSAFAAAVGGYPKNAVLISTVVPGLFWINLVDSNSNDPDAGGANWVQFSRVKLSANTTFYVRADGDDSHTGLVNSAGGGWLTGQHGIDVLAKSYDFNGWQVTLNFGAGTFVGFNPGSFVGQTQAFIVNGVGVTTIVNSGIGIGGNGIGVTVQNLKVINASGNGISCGNGGNASIGAGVEFGACVGGAHIYANNGVINVNASYAISGGASAHFQAFNAGKIIVAGTIVATLSGTPAFGTFAAIDIESFLNIATPAMTFSGTGATGTRFSLNNLSGIFGVSANINFFPGNAAGTNLGNGAIYN